MKVSLITSIISLKLLPYYLNNFEKIVISKLNLFSLIKNSFYLFKRFRIHSVLVSVSMTSYWKENMSSICWENWGWCRHLLITECILFSFSKTRNRLEPYYVNNSVKIKSYYVNNFVKIVISKWNLFSLIKNLLLFKLRKIPLSNVSK